MRSYEHELSTFLDSGIYQFRSSHVVFLDPVRVLSRSYTRFRVSPSAYYSRFFSSKQNNAGKETEVSSKSKKGKRKQKKPHILNERERAADQRHQEIKPVLLKAHEALLYAKDLLTVIRNLRSEFCSSSESGAEQSFVELGKVWQAPMYEITLNFSQCN